VVGLAINHLRQGFKAVGFKNIDTVFAGGFAGRGGVVVGRIGDFLEGVDFP
jgi:hypothetical protein